MKFKPLVIWIWNQNIAISTIVDSINSTYKKVTRSNNLINLLEFGNRIGGIVNSVLASSDIDREQSENKEKSLKIPKG
jgi:hypothetical protein